LRNSDTICEIEREKILELEVIEEEEEELMWNV